VAQLGVEFIRILCFGTIYAGIKSSKFLHVVAQHVPELLAQHAPVWVAQLGAVYPTKNDC
jgi:hypothetical protein